MGELNIKIGVDGSEVVKAASDVGKLNTAEEKLNKTEGKRIETEEKLDKTEGKVVNTEGKRNDIENKLNDTQEKLQKTEGKLNETNETLNKTVERLNETQEKLHKTEEKLAEVEEKLKKQKKEQSDESNNLNKVTTLLFGSQQNYNKILSVMPPTLKMCITEMQGLIAASEAFIATPIGMVLAALAVVCAEVSVAFKTVSYWLNNTVEGQHEMAKVTGVVNGVMGWCGKVVANAGERLWKLVERIGMATEKFPKLTRNAKIMATLFAGYLTWAINSVITALETLSYYTDVVGYLEEGEWAKAGQALVDATAKLKENTKAIAKDARDSFLEARKLFDNIEASVKLEKEKVEILEKENELKVTSAKLDKEIAEGYNKVAAAQGAERERLAREVEHLIDEKAAEEESLAKMKLRAAKEALKITPSSIEDKGAVAQAEADLIRVRANAEASKRGLERMIANAERRMGADALKEANKAMKEDAMMAFLNKKDEEDQKRQARQRALAIYQAEIEGMEEGHEKMMATLTLNEEKENIAIEQQRDALLMNKVAKAKQEWTAQGSKGTFNPNAITLTKEEEADFDKMLDAIKKKYVKLHNDVAKEEAMAMQKYLAQYGSMEERRLAITQQYEEKIRTAKTEGEKKTLRKQMESALNDLDFEKMKLLDINWEVIFNGLDKVSKKHLELLRDQLQEYLQEGIKRGAIDPKNAKVISEQISKVSTEMQKRNPWSLKGDTAAGYDSMRNSLQAELAGLMAERSKVDPTSDRFKELNTQILKVIKDMKELDDEEKSLRVRAAEFGEALSKVAQRMQEVENLTNALGLGDTELGRSVSGIASGTANAASAMANFADGNVIQAAADAVNSLKDYGRVVQGITGWGAGNADEVNKTTERLTKANEVLAGRIQDLTEAMGNSAGVKAIYAYEQALEAQKEINKNSLEVLRAQMNYSSAHHSNAYYADDRTIRSYNAQAQKAFKAAGVDAVSITGLDSVMRLSPEQMKAIYDYAPQLWGYLTSVGKYDKSEYWQNVVDQAGKAEKLTEQIQNNLTQTSFDQMRNSYLDALTDMESSSADFAQSIEDMMYKAVINSLVLNDDFDAWLKGWQKDYAKAVKDGNTAELKRLQDEAVIMRDQKVSERNAIASTMNYNSSGAASATINAAMSISEDTAQDIVGRMTAIQLICESERGTLNEIASAASQLPSLVALTTAGNTVMLDMRNLMITGNSYLEDIAKYNKAMYTEWGGKIDRIQNTLESKL